MDLVTSHRNYQWLRNLITGDQKWVLYINYMHRRQWVSPGQTGVATPKADLHSKKVMLSVWWSVNGIIHWEILPNGRTITADLYCQQLDRVAKKLKGKQDRIYYLHDNARPYVAKSTCEKIIEVRMDYHSSSTLFSQLGFNGLPFTSFSFSHHLREKKFDDENDVKMDIGNFFGQNSQNFYEHGIQSLPERWRQVIDSSGVYITES